MTAPIFDSEPIKISELEDGVGSNWLHWPGRVAATKLLGVTPLQFRQMVREGEVREYKAPDKSRRYNPEELEEISEGLADKVNDETMVAGRPIEGMRVANDLLKQQQQHNERILNLALTGTEKVVSALLAQNERLVQENAKLAETHAEAMGVLMKARGDELEQQVQANASMSSQARRDALVQAILPHVGPVLQRVAGAAAEFLPGNQEPSRLPETSDGHSEPPTLADRALEMLRAIGPDKLSLAVALIPEEDQPMALSVIESLKGNEQCAISTESP